MTFELPAAMRTHPFGVRLIDRDHWQCRHRFPQSVVPPFAAHGNASVWIGSATTSFSSRRSESSNLARRSR